MSRVIYSLPGRPGLNGMIECVAVTTERLAQLERAEAELKRISSCTPNTLQPGTPKEWRCSLCLAFINVARDTLGYQPWPAIPHTPKVHQ
jgi:hypothetical protein